MRRNILIAVLAALLVLCVSCQTSLSIPYTQPSNIDMSRYRSVAVASASEYKGSQSLPYYIRCVSDYYAYSQSVINRYGTSYSFDSIKSATRSGLTRMVENVFASSSYYSTLPASKTDTYVSLYKIGRDPSEMLRSDGVDALIVPRISSIASDEYIDIAVVKDYRGTEKVVYTLYRKVDISFTLTVLDTATNRIVAMREYSTSAVSHEDFDPKYYYLTTILSVDDLVSNALSDKISEIVDDFIPTRRYAEVTFKDNSPKDESVEDAYKAARNGNFDYALELFSNAWENSSHVPSGYNAALILASRSDYEGALEILSEIRSEGLDDREVDRFYSRLVSLKEKNDEARKQYEQKSDTASTEAVSPYSYLF